MDGAAVHSGEASVGYDELHSRAGRIATGLRDMGIEAGDRVAILLRNEPDFLAASLGAGLLAAVPVPINWHWKGRELRHVLTDSASRVLFAHADLLAGIEADLPDGLRVVEISVPAEVRRAYGVSDQAGRPSGVHPEFESWLEGCQPWSGDQPDAPLSLIYTSGTTGLPKGVLRAASTPEARQQVVAAVLRFFGLAPTMRTLIPAPMYHTAPNVHSLFAATLGIDMTLMPRFDAEEFLRLVQEHRINHVQMVPTMFVRMLALPEEVRLAYDVSSLEAIVHAAAPCPVHVKRAMIDWLGPIILEYYGGTETGVVTWSDSDGWLAHPGSVGRAVEGASVRILSPEGDVLGPSQPGQVYVRPPEFWPKFTYLGDEAKRRDIEHDGYVTIGDIGYVDEDGYLYLTDRSVDIVNVGGVNVYPVEIEAALLTLPGVRDAAVFGIPDDRYGEALAAHVDVDPTSGLDESRIREHVRRELADYKVPRVVVLDENLPREDSGKMFKRRLRERYWAAAGRNI